MGVNDHKSLGTQVAHREGAKESTTGYVRTEEG